MSEYRWGIGRWESHTFASNCAWARNRSDTYDASYGINTTYLPNIGRELPPVEFERFFAALIGLHPILAYVWPAHLD